MNDMCTCLVYMIIVITDFFHTKIFNIQKMKIRASGPITSWQIDGEMVETVRVFYFGGGVQKSL